MNISDKLLQLTCGCLSFKVFDFGLSISPNVHIQLLLLTFGVDHPSAWWQQERAQPQRVNLKEQETCRSLQQERILQAIQVLYLVASVTSESYVDVLMEAPDCSLQVLHGDQHVLDHMVLLVKSSDGLSLGELQQ